MHCFYSPAYFYPLPPEHPFPMEKFPLAYRLLASEVPGIVVRPAPFVSLEDLRRVHLEEYLCKLSHAGLSDGEAFRLGFAWTPELFARCRYETGGTVAALMTALEQGVAANLAGGTHHAFPDRGLGFCLLNDVAVAVRRLHAERPDLRVLVADTDAHQGNGTHAIFRGDDRVFTYSIHVEKNYPTIKEPGDLDVGLARWVSGATYLARLQETLPDAIGAFEPDLIVWISGADPHEGDRFGQMKLTTGDLETRDRWVASLCRDYEVPLALLYGGGYNRRPGMTARLHANSVKITRGVYCPGD
ncbi:MAG: histone deacetylase [Verrucomicrobia bacterium]|nr:histone deacetylase [Verrucomicrobiota bacterium]